MSDQEDEVAIAGDMEPESPMGDVDDGNEDEAAIQLGDGPGGPSGTVHARGRNVSEKTRALFKKAAAEIAKQNAAGSSEFGEYDEGYTPRDPVTPAPAVAPQSAPPAAPGATAAPAPSLDPGIAQAREKLDLRASELDQREQSLLAREASSDVLKHRDAYFERGAPALVDLIKQWTGLTSEDDIRDEVADLITELSGSVLGVQVEPNIRAKIEAKRATKSVKAQMGRLSEREKAVNAEHQRQADAAHKRNVEVALGNEIRLPEQATRFPFLAAEDNAGELVFEIVEARHRQDGVMLPWPEAAKQANDYLQQKWRAAYDKRAHLFAASSNGSPVGNGQRPQGDPQGIRRSHTLTNGSAPQATAPSQPEKPPTVVNGRLNNEALRAETRKRMRAAFKRDQPEE